MGSSWLNGGGEKGRLKRVGWLRIPDLSFFRRPVSNVGRILESDISAKQGCRIQVSDLLFSDDPSAA